MEALDRLNNKVTLLLKKYAALETENKRLRKAVATHEKETAELKKKLDSLEQGMVSVHLGSSVAGDEEKDNMRAQLDNVIAEIDKILNTLND